MAAAAMIRTSRSTSQGAEQFSIKADFKSKSLDEEAFLVPSIDNSGDEFYFSKRAPLLRAFILGANDGAPARRAAPLQPATAACT